MMKKRRAFILGLIWLCFIFKVSAQSATHNIAIQLKPYTNCKIYLGGYFGLGKFVADTAWLDMQGNGRFSGNLKLNDGMYFIVSPDNRILFEFLLTDGQRFSIIADTAKLNAIQYLRSPDNIRFKNYLHGVQQIAQESSALSKNYKQAKSKNDSLHIFSAQKVLNKKMNQLRDSVAAEDPSSLTSLLIRLGKPVELPEYMALHNRNDSVNAGAYLRKRFWDKVPFNDDRLLYSSIFEPKVDAYLDQYVPPAADSVIKAIEYMLLYARTGKQMFPYLLMKLTNRYYQPKQIGQNKVFLYLFNNYFQKGDTAILSAESKKAIFDHAYQLMANEPGDIAPDMKMTDLHGEPQTLYGFKKKYTLVVFWDPSCEHCQHILPQIDSIYRKEWKDKGVGIYTVNINHDLLVEMKHFIETKHLSSDWVNSYQKPLDEQNIVKAGKLNYHQLYDIYDTPSLYLLDENKRILAKHLSISQINALINYKQ